MGCNVYSDTELTRKLGKFKTLLYDGGFYSTDVECITYTESGASGYFNRSVSVASATGTVKGIAEYGPVFLSYDNKVETFEGDVRLTVRESDASSLDNADLLRINTTQYYVKSSKPSLHNLDRIFTLRIAGKES